MRATARPYDQEADYDRVCRFLLKTYRTSGPHINWLQPRWEYMHFHPLVRDMDLGSIGIWEAGEEVVGLVHPEHALGTVYVQIEPGWEALRAEMLDYAEEHLSVRTEGARRLRVYINEEDRSLEGLAREMGFDRGPGGETMAHLPVHEVPQQVSAPPGFRLKSLADDNDLRKVDRVLWRGFGHGDEPPEGGIADREFMQSAPNFAHDLNILVESPDGNFVSYCGMWYEQEHRVAYVEPVATDPDFRRMGLARAVVTEGIRRCARLGARVAHVGSDMPLYRALGFRPMYRCSLWQREWS